MVPEVGYFALLLALVLSVTQSAVPFVAARRVDRAVAAFAEQAALGQFIFLVVAFASLTYAFVTSDFSVEVVAANSHTAKPLLYKVSGVWGTTRDRCCFGPSSWLFSVPRWPCLAAICPTG
jgi:cytochrome c-type biogenesis protein CcmF